MASKNYNINSNLYVNDGKIVGGYNNNLTGGTYSTILGGQNNTTDNNWSSIIGGKGNIQSGTNNFNTFIGVGYQNTISHPGGFSINYNSIINGRDNHISTTGLTSFSFNTIVGGRQNSSLGVWGFVGGGAANYLGINGYRFSKGIFPPDPTRNEYGSFIGGGITNRVYGSFNSVVGGRFNTISQRDLYTNIGGGRNNSVYTYDAYGVTDTSRWGTNQFIGGGFSNGIYGRTGIFFNLDRLSRESLIVGGNNNYITSSERAFIGGGRNNQMTYSDYSLVVGGFNNDIYAAFYSSVVGGNDNYVRSSYASSIVGGRGNQIDSDGFLSQHQFIGGGRDNKLLGNTSGNLSDYSSIVGGQLNTITASTHSLIGGGRNNTINDGNDSSIVGGQGNTISTGTTHSFIGGGQGNITFNGASHTFIGGGKENYSYSIYTTIGGGDGNVINDSGWSSIVGGFGNSMSSNVPGSNWVSFIGGGGGNSLDSTAYSNIVGGQANEIISIGPSIRAFNSIGGGRSNTINDANDSSIVGGQGNTIFTGVTHSSILGGQSNTVNHSNSHIIGSNITSVSANTTHVERLNIGTVTTGSSSTDVFVRESNGMVNTSPISSLLSAAGVVEQLNDLSDVTIDMLPYSATTQADDGKLLFYEKDTEQWIVNDTVTHGTSVINGKKSTAGTLQIGTPVYLVGFDNDLHTVEAANATTATTMPCIGLVAETMDNVNSKHIMTFGKLQGVDTTTGSTINPNNETWSINDDLYVSTTTGGLTKFRPTGAATQIQRIAKVLKVSVNDGQLLIFNTARTAGLPNLTENYIWVGDSNNQPVETALSSFTQQKYAASIPFTAATSQTVTHNLNDTDVIVQLKDSTGTLVIPDVVDNYTNNTVDIQVSSTETFRVIIIG